MQSLWIDKLGWDDPVSPQTAQHWITFREELSQLSSISYLGGLVSKNSEVEIHGFSDASQVAVVFLRIMDTDSDTRFRCPNSGSSSQESYNSSTGAFGGGSPCETFEVRSGSSRLTGPTGISLNRLFGYSLAWINLHPLRWKEFVRNRVILIQELLPHGQWKLIRGKENPADCASRGLSSSQLVRHKLWWTGLDTHPRLGQLFNRNRTHNIRWQKSLGSFLSPRLRKRRFGI